MRELLAYSQWAVVEEKLTLRIRADNNGDIYLPVAWYSSDGTQDCDYDWMVGIDGNNEVEYSGIWSSNWKIRVGYGLSPLSVHTVIVKPKEEDFGWLRAFWYKGTDIASSLINIISDKSYKGYALSEIFTGDYYKAYQYYGCSNLINTDEELLPDTLEIVGNNYRYYEYAGCSSLVHNAEEKILKTVKVIWDNYRAYQYQNCVWINRIDMRAINWASVGNNYRQNQFDGMATDRNPVEIYIEGWIEEGGDWWLVNSKVKGVYVYQGLVSDYQTKLSTITSSKIKKNADWDNFEYEFIEYIGLADSNGVIRVPVAWISTTNGQNCAYDWYISIDGETAVQYTGTWSTTYLSVGSWLIEWSEHRVVIKPTTVSWWWWRAFWFFGSWAEWYIKELIHDSYKCYAISRTNTGDYYKADTYTACANLINSYEKLPTSVTTIGNNYMANCYAWCTGLKTAFWEILHKWISIWSNYRSMEYTGCSAMEVHEWIAWYSGTYPTNYKYEYLSGAGNNMKVYITRYEALASGLTNSMWLVDNKIEGVYVYVDDIYNYEVNSNWSITKFKPRYYGYVCYEFKDINRYTKLVASVNINRWPINVWYYLTWWIAVNRKRKFSQFAITAADGWGYNTWGSGSTPQAVIYGYNLTKPWDLSTVPQNPTNTLASQQSTWSWSNYTFVWWQRYSRLGKLIWNNARNGSNYDYYSTFMSGWTIFNAQWGGDITKSSAWISDNGLFAWWVAGKYRLASKENPSGATNIWGNGQSVGLTFSSDGLKMYSWYETIKEYSLPRPRDTANKVDTGRTLNIGAGWSFDISVDWKYLFVYRDGTIYQYTYE